MNTIFGCFYNLFAKNKCINSYNRTNSTIITKNRNEYVKAMLIYQGMTEAEINKMNISVCKKLMSTDNCLISTLKIRIFYS